MRRFGLLLATWAFSLPLWAGGSEDLLREGVRLANEGKTDLAIQTLRQAAEADSSRADTQTALGMVALQAQRYDVAQTALERAVDIDPQSQTALYSLAMLYEKIQKLPEARYAWQRFLNLSPSADLADLARRHLDRLP